jgi:hypothetical protein
MFATGSIVVYFVLQIVSCKFIVFPGIFWVCYIVLRLVSYPAYNLLEALLTIQFNGTKNIIKIK